jgi:hypothetical protein
MSTLEWLSTAAKNSTASAVQPATHRPTATPHAPTECTSRTPGRVDSTSSCPAALSRLNSPAAMAAGMQKYRISPMLVSAPNVCQKSDWDSDTVELKLVSQQDLVAVAINVWLSG